MDEVSGIVDALTFESCLRLTTRILDDELVFYNFDVDLLCNNVTTACGPQTSTD